MLKRAWQEKVPIACETKKTPASVEFDFSPRQLSVDNISRVRLLVSVVQRLDSAIHRINLYPVDSTITFPYYLSAG